MIETYTLRILEEHAPRLLSPSEGKRLGSGLVRLLKLRRDDNRIKSIKAFHHELRANGKGGLFTAWDIERRYTKAELESATLFRLKLTSTFEPAGEECGTKYDEAAACPSCGAGARQITPLYLPEKRIPKIKDFSRTIAGEIIVSRRMKELFELNEIAGATMSPVRSNPSSSAESKEWFQLIVQNEKAEVIAPTCVGIDPFDYDEKGEFRCPTGDLIGLNLLSEVSINSASRDEADIISTRQFVGTRRGLLRPERIFLISSKFRRLIESEKLRGLEVEVAHLV